MKPFQSLLFLVVIILIGGVAALWWGKSIQDATAPVEVVDDLVAEPVEEELDLGSYLIFQSVSTTDAGTQDWANDDTDTYTFYRLALGDATSRARHTAEDLVPFATIEHGPEFGGNLVAYVYGSDLLLHRYETDREYDPQLGSLEEGEEAAAVMSLTGKITTVRDENWQTFRSPNGRYEVEYDFGGAPSDDFGTFEIVEVSTGIRQTQHKITLDSGEIGNPEPFLIDNNGRYLYVHQVCGCEAILKGLWEIDLITGESRALHELVEMDAWDQTSLDPESRRLLVVNSQRQLSDEGPFDELFPPTTISLLDLESMVVTELLIDEKHTWVHPFLDPEGNDRYILMGTDERWSQGYLVGFRDAGVADEPYFTSQIRDWVENWIVVDNRNDASWSIRNLDDPTINFEIELYPGGLSYIGSIEFE